MRLDFQTATLEGRAHRKIHALHFELIRGDRSVYLIVWPGQDQLEHQGVPTFGQDWLDVGTGDLLTMQGERWRVARVLLYRVHPAEANGTPISTGRPWLRG